jgi:amino acid adenylation domain-containing protein
MTLLAAFGLLLNKYSGDDDICIGVPIANRENSELERIIGLFVNTIILRMHINNSQSFKDLLHTTRQTTLEALAHNDLPFEKLIEILQPERKANVNPISQVLFAYQNTPRPLFNPEGIIPERILIKETVSPLDITLYAWENAGIIEGDIEFNSDLLERETITRFKENFISLLERIIENPDIYLTELSIISENDRKELDDFNNTEAQIPDCQIQNFFEGQVKASPDKIALISGTDELTYRKLEERANKLSNHLISLGVVSGDVIGICIERSSEMIISILAVLKAGCCYLPLDPAFPSDRLSYMYEDSGAKIIIAQNSLKNRLKVFSKASLVVIDDKRNKINNCPATRPVIKSDTQAMAYLLYTSGSTGEPKGVKVHHQAVVNLINSMSRTPGINKNDKLLAVVTLSFDMSVFEIFLPLSNGATIVVADSQDVRDGHALINLIEKHNITFLQATPSLYYILLAAGWKGKANLKALCGGEALTPGMVKKILPQVGELWNCYGPTETTVYSICTRITGSDKKILIGKPIGNTRISILDKNNTVLPLGAIGELGIGGMGVAKGYFNQPYLSSEKFISIGKGQVVYKTGDRGRFLKDGNIELFGRLDNQIKIRGIRIEPAEIEILLSKIEGINEAVVKLQSFGENDDRLVAFLNVSDKTNLNTRGIDTQIKEKLPIHMIPSFYKILKDFPRTSNGKIDRKVLYFNSNNIGKSERDYTETLTPSEKIIHDIWCKAFRRTDISVTDNFFNVGGNSLLAISVFSRIESAFNIKLSLRIFFDSPRIRDLGEIIDIAKQKVIEKKQDINEKVFSKIIKGQI